MSPSLPLNLSVVNVVVAFTDEISEWGFADFDEMYVLGSGCFC
jgi:hypothetical protein